MRTLDLNTLALASGGHRPDDGEYCLMEAVAYIVGEPWSDRPACVSPVLSTFGMQLNDRLPNDRRQEMKTLITLLPGTAGDGLDETRSYMALDWLIRTYTPAWLDLAGLTEEATALRDLRCIADVVAAQSAGPVVRHTREKAAAAWAAAGDAARAAAGVAARVAAWVAAGDAARVAAGDALKPTVDQLQTSAIELFKAMIRPGNDGK